MCEKFMVVVQIYPNPRMDVEITSTGVIGPIACLPKDAIYHKSGDDTVCQAKGKGVGLLLNVFAEDVRLLWGRIPQPGDDPALFKPIIHRIFHPSPNSDEAAGYNERKRKNQYGTEVRLVLVFNFKQPDLGKGEIGGKQGDSGKDAEWKKIFRKLFYQIENMFFKPSCHNRHHV